MKHGLGQYWGGEKSGRRYIVPGLATEAKYMSATFSGDGDYHTGPYCWPFVLQRPLKITKIQMPYYGWLNLSNVVRFGFYSNKDMKPWRKIFTCGPYGIYTGYHLLEVTGLNFYLPMGLTWAVIMTDDPTQDIEIDLHSVTSYPRDIFGMDVPFRAWQNTSYVTLFTSFALPDEWPSYGEYQATGTPHIRIGG